VATPGWLSALDAFPFYPRRPAGRRSANWPMGISAGWPMRGSALF